MHISPFKLISRYKYRCLLLIPLLQDNFLIKRYTRYTLWYVMR